MKKLIITSALVLSSIVLNAQNKITAGIMGGALYGHSYGGWVSIGNFGLEHVRGTAKEDLFPSTTNFTNVLANYYYKNIFVGAGIQKLESIDDNSTYPCFSVGTNYVIKDAYIIRGEVLTGGVGITTLNLGVGFKF